MATAIEFNHVGKQYRLGVVSMGTLGNDLKRWWTTSVLGKEDPFLKVGEVNDRSVKGESEYVWALKDIDFKVEQGEVVGIIGRNGAGKSTLLKLLSRVTGPTVGEIRARGRIGSLLEVGTGFHPEMTGRENIYLNGTILGMTRPEIDRKLDEIIDFSGCERYIDTPVKRYSSGMMVRLGFAVAAHLEPEILIVDEVLAVGDAEFQKKAIGKMQDVSKGEGRTVLFVSHNMASVKALCDRGIVLKNGSVDYDGTIGNAVEHYMKSSDLKQFSNEKIIDSVKYESSEIKLTSITANGSDTNVLYLDEGNRNIEIKIEGNIISDIPIGIECQLFDNNGIFLAKFAPGLFAENLNKIRAGNFCVSSIMKLPENITNGEYLLEIQVTYPKIQYLARILNRVKVFVSGCVTPMGAEIKYSESGFVILR